MNILEEIVAHKRQQVAQRKELYPAKLLEQSIFFESKPVSMRAYLLRPDRHGIIAEFKRRSPSKGDINRFASVEEVTLGYMQAGASALSVLTDEDYFGGSSNDLREARKFNYCPILRKDFVVDEYQVLEAKSIGADTVLLIAAVLSAAELNQLAALTVSLGMEVLMEVRDAEELDKFNGHVGLVGVNNRDLRTFEVSPQRSLELADKIPTNTVKISESGISNAETIVQLQEAGFNGFLIGEAFMREAQPEQACQQLIKALNAAKQPDTAS